MYNLYKNYNHKYMLRSKRCILDTNCLEWRKKKGKIEKKKLNAFVIMFDLMQIGAYFGFLSKFFFFTCDSSSHRLAYFTPLKRNRPEPFWTIRKSMRVTFIHKSSLLSIFSFVCLQNIRVFSIELPMFWIFRMKSTECEEIAVKPKRHTLLCVHMFAYRFSEKNNRERVSGWKKKFKK